MTEEIKWVVGIGVSVALAMFAHTLAAFRNVRSSQSKSNEKIYDRIREVENASASKEDLRELRTSIENQFAIDREDRRERHNNMRDFITMTLKNSAPQNDSK